MLGERSMKKITNCMEISVEECLDKLLEESNGCKCEKCRYDMMAIALNNLKPYYVTTHLGEVITKIKNMEQQSEANIVVEVTKAIKKVHMSPKH
jgi:competence protein ComFB